MGKICTISETQNSFSEINPIICTATFLFKSVRTFVGASANLKKCLISSKCNRSLGHFFRDLQFPYVVDIPCIHCSGYEKASNESVGKEKALKNSFSEIVPLFHTKQTTHKFSVPLFSMKSLVLDTAPPPLFPLRNSPNIAKTSHRVTIYVSIGALLSFERFSSCSIRVAPFIHAFQVLRCSE